MQVVAAVAKSQG
jgi:hypothetical protein